MAATILKADLLRTMNNKDQITREWLVEFRQLLMSDKFTGTELVCHCGLVVSVRCRWHPLDPPQHVRKDLISTADVLRYLDLLETLLTEDR